MKDLKFTLYDFFGYLFPGSVAFLSLLILFWLIFYPSSPIPVRALNPQVVTALTLVAYILGHITQALGNIAASVFGPNFEEETLNPRKPDSPVHSLLSAASAYLARCGLDGKTTNSKWLFTIMDETIVQEGVPSEREIFQYREGFYRGLWVAFALLSVSLIARLLVSGTAIQLDTEVHQVSRGMVSFAVILSMFASYLSFRRFRRFGTYRVERALAAFIVVSSKTTQDKQVSANGKTGGK